MHHFVATFLGLSGSGCKSYPATSLTLWLYGFPLEPLLVFDAKSPEAVSRHPSPKMTVVASRAVDALLGAPIPHHTPERSDVLSGGGIGSICTTYMPPPGLVGGD